MRLKREILLVISVFFVLIFLSKMGNNLELNNNNVVLTEFDQDNFTEEITFDAISSYPHDLTDPLFNLTFIVNENSLKESIVLEIQEDLGEIGIGVNIEVLR